MKSIKELILDKVERQALLEEQERKTGCDTFEERDKLEQEINELNELLFHGDYNLLMENIL